MTALWHADQLDQAINQVRDPETMCAKHSLCATALQTRTQEHIDGQLKIAAECLDETRDAVRASNPEATEDEILIVSLRSAIGAAFTFGLGVGLELPSVSKAEDAGLVDETNADNDCGAQG